MFIAAPSTRGIAPPNLHTESQSTHLFITNFIKVSWIIVIISRKRPDNYNDF